MVVNLHDLLKSISIAMDFINPKLNNHQLRVANISYFVGKELGLNNLDMKRLLTASLIHDIGGFSQKERIDTLNFEISKWNKHGEIGGKILEESEIFIDIAPIIFFHHKNFNQRKSFFVKDSDFLLSQIINVSDRFEILTKTMRIDETIRFIERYSGKKFCPEVVKSLKKIVNKDIFNFELKYLGIRFFEDELELYQEVLNHKKLLNLFFLFSKIIDFKSPFTCAHSSGISEIAKQLGKELGLGKDDVYSLKYAGLVHDIGKIGIPSELINKNGRLTENQYKTMKTHIYYSCQILKIVKSFNKIYDYAVHHHERLDGCGYPFGLKGDFLSLGAKIMAVSDVYMALREDRPYRKGLSKDEAYKIMNKLAKTNKLSRDIVNLIFKNSIFDEIIEKNKILTKKSYAKVMVM